MLDGYVGNSDQYRKEHEIRASRASAHIHSTRAREITEKYRQGGQQPGDQAQRRSFAAAVLDQTEMSKGDQLQSDATLIQHKYNQDVLQTEPRQRSASLRGLSKKDKEKLKITKTESEKKRGFGLMNIFRKKKKKPEEATPKQQRPNHKKELTFRQ